MTRYSDVRRFLAARRPVTLVTWGYAFYMGIGCVLLCLPIAHAQSGLSIVDNLFTATSAVSTTGLATISPGDSYNLFGQIVIATLIQLGGIGYMTLGSFIMLAVRHRLDDLHEGVARQAFVLPQGMDLARFVRGVVLFTLLIECVGAAILIPAFSAAGVPSPIWNGIFHSISAFCTAGFSLFDNGLEDFTGNAVVSLTVAGLSYLGAIGFIVMSDWWRWISRRRKTTLTSRIILRVTVILATLGTLALGLTDSTLAQLPVSERWLAAFFQVMTAMTTVGFDTVPINTLAPASILLIIVAMVMGASPSGTGGGIKSTTVAVFYGAVKAALRGRMSVVLLGRTVSPVRVQLAMAVFGFYMSCLIVGTFVLLLVDEHGLMELMFEATSAIGTVGLSLGITGDLSTAGKYVVIALMFLGRLGPITAGMALFPRPDDAPTFRAAPEDLAI